MRYLRSILQDAKRPIPSNSPWVQRSENAAAAPSAPPVQEQEDGAFTVYRFQKEGALGSREVSGDGSARRVQPVRRSVSPSLPGVNAPVFTAEVRQPVEEISDSVRSTVNEASRRSGLAKGETHSAKTQQDTGVPEWVSSGEKGSLATISDDSTSVGSIPDRYDPSVKRDSEAIQRDVGEHQLRRVPGPDAPSEPNPASPRDLDGPIGVALESDEKPAPSQETGGYYDVPLDPRPERLTSLMETASEPERIPRETAHSPITESAAPPRDEWWQPAPAPGTPVEDPPGPRVQIGQVDIVVVSSAAPTTAKPASNRHFTSRNYLRRL